MRRSCWRAGFGEAGAEGQRRQQALKEAAGSMRLLGPEHDRPGQRHRRHHALGQRRPGDGGASRTASIALVSQSGGILGSLLSRAVGRGIGFSKLVATGNEADLDVSDIVDHLLEDDATSVIALYLGGAAQARPVPRSGGQGRPPGQAHRRLQGRAGRKPAARSAASHTGALAGADRVYEALFRQVGVIRAETFADLLDIPVGTGTPAPCCRGRRIAVLTSTGGAAHAWSPTAAGLAGFETPPPDEATAERLRALDIRDAVLDRNPIDVTLAGLQPDLFRSAIGTLLESPTYDAVIVIVGSSGLGQPDLVARPVTRGLASSDKPLLVYRQPRSAGHRPPSQPAAACPLSPHPKAAPPRLSAMLRVGCRMAPGHCRKSSPRPAPLRTQPISAPDR